VVQRRDRRRKSLLLRGERERVLLGPAQCLAVDTGKIPHLTTIGRLKGIPGLGNPTVPYLDDPWPVLGFVH